jgi:hypothetical protein
MSAVKAPPAKRGTAAAKKAVTAPVPDVQAKSVNQLRYEGIMGLAQLGQGLCLMAGLHADAMTIGKFFPPVAAEVANIADDNETVAKPIDFIIKIGPYAALIAAGMPLVMQLLANHKIVDASAMHGYGVVPPEVLEAQMRAEMLRMQAEAMRAQQEAVNEANAAAEAYAKMMAPADASP